MQSIRVKKLKEEYKIFWQYLSMPVYVFFIFPYQIYADELNPQYQCKQNHSHSKICIEAIDSQFQVTINGTALTKLEKEIPFDPTINELGDYAYSLVSSSNLSSSIFLNQQVIPTPKGLNHKLLIDNSALFFLNFYKEYDKHYLSSICRFDIIGHKLSCKSLSFLAEQLVAIDQNHIGLSGFNESEGKYKIYILDKAFSEVKSLSSLEPMFIHPKSAKIINVEGDGYLTSLFYAFYLFNTYQKGEPFSFSNNFMGRLSWNQNYRIKALGFLYEATNYKNVEILLNDVVTNVLSQVSSNIFFPTKKYSTDESSLLNLSIDNGMIYEALLSVYPELSDKNKEQVKEKAKAIWEYYESDWYGSYRFPPFVKFIFDGVIMPFNQQNILGLIGCQLYDISGDEKYFTRVKKLYDNFSNEFYHDGHTYIWHYWPQEFYNGWQAGKYQSNNAPSRAATKDELFEDVSHADLDLEFLLKASHTLKNKLPINLEVIFNNIKKGKYTFSRFISGSEKLLTPDYTNLPQGSFLYYDEIKNYYSHYIVNPFVDFDSQNLFLSYALAAKLNKNINLSETMSVQISHINPLNLNIEKQKKITIRKTSNENCSIHEGENIYFDNNCGAIMEKLNLELGS